MPVTRYAIYTGETMICYAFTGRYPDSGRSLCFSKTATRDRTRRGINYRLVNAGCILRALTASLPRNEYY